MDDLISRKAAIDIVTEQTHEAVKMAVKALSSPDDSGANVGDLISRKAAIYAIRHHQEAVLGDNEYDEGIAYGYAAAHRHIIDIVNELPPVQPERKRGKWEVHNIVDYAQRPTGRKIGRCPFCGYLTGDFRTRLEYYHNLTHFCANCGADMEGSDGFDPGRL